MGNRNAVARIAIAAVLLVAPAVQAEEPWCKATQKPDLVRVRLAVQCGEPARIELRRNGDDRAPVQGVKQDDGWWLVPKFNDAMNSVTLCSEICGFASACAAAVPVGEREAGTGRRVCVAEYQFSCDERAWTLAVQANPQSRLRYTRKRDESREQRGEISASPAPLARLPLDKVGTSVHVAYAPTVSFEGGFAWRHEVALFVDRALFARVFGRSAEN